MKVVFFMALGVLAAASSQTPTFNATRSWSHVRGSRMVRDEPTFVQAWEPGYLGDEVALGLSIPGDTRTHPSRLTHWHHIANDGRLSFEPAQGDVVAPDRETGSLWRIDGVAVPGLLKGLRMAPVNFHVGARYSRVA